MLGFYIILKQNTTNTTIPRSVNSVDCDVCVFIQNQKRWASKILETGQNCTVIERLATMDELDYKAITRW